MPVIAEDLEGLPEMAIGIYDWSLVVDHQERRSRLVGSNPARLERFRRLLLGEGEANARTPPAKPYRVLGEVCSRNNFV